LTLQCGSPLKWETAAQQIGMTSVTLRKYVGLLEQTLNVITLAPFAVNPVARVVRAPKVYLLDQGLTWGLRGYEDARLLEVSGMLGTYMELACIAELAKWCLLEPTSPELRFWSKTSVSEVDLVISNRGFHVPFEIRLARLLHRATRTIPVGISVDSGGCGRYYAARRDSESLLLRHITILALVLVTAWPAPTHAQPVVGETDKGFPATSLFFFDIHGSFRSRTELWQDMDLSLAPVVNKYGVYPQVSDDEGLRETTDFRMRLSPVLAVADRANVHLVADLFSAVGGEGGSSRTAFYDAYAIPAPGTLGSPLSSASVRMAWVDLLLFHILTVQAGRVPAHWGMGLVENDARDIDTDGGDAVDGLTLVATLWEGFSVALSLDWPLEGRSMYDPFAPWGRAYDLGDLDDIWQWRIKVLSMGKKADEGGSVSWGVYTRFRWQDYSSLGQESPAEGCRSPYPWFPEYGCVEMLYRGAFVFTPDFWLHATTPLGTGLYLDIETEIAARLGWLEATQQLSGNASDKTLAGIGGAVKATLRMPGARVRLEGGLASGDDGSLAFGVLDRPTVAEPDEASWLTSPVSRNDLVTSFLFHPNFLVDQVLFRRTIGAVTNSVYVKPSAGYALWEDEGSALWLDASVLWASALVSTSTPGNASDLGFEIDAGATLTVGEHVEARMQGATLIPGSGLSRAAAGDPPLPFAARLLFDVTF